MCMPAYVTSLDAAFTKPVAAEHLAGLLDAKGSRLETEFATGRIDGGTRRLVSWDEREVPFDLLVSVPLHGGAEFVERSPGLGDELGFVRVDPHTLQSTAAPNVFALGDATNVPISKAGSVTHFEGNTLPAHPDAAGRPAGHVGARDAHAAASVDMFKLCDEDFVEHVDGVITVGEFYALAAGGEIIFT